MLGAEASLVDLYRPLAVLERLFMLALRTQQQGEVLERRRDVGMIRTESLLSSGFGRPFAERLRLTILALRDVARIKSEI